MKIHTLVLPILIAGLSGPFLTGCATCCHKPTPTVTTAAVGKAKEDGKGFKDVKEEDEYAIQPAYDPWQPMNRGIFWFNDKVYNYLLRPVSWTYDKALPGFLRTGVYNVYDNIGYPIRAVNDLLQANIPRFGLETGKFAVNTTAGVGGLMRVSDKIPALADVPPGDTAQTFAKWGIPAGPYFIIPLLGPSTVRDTFGVAGDYGLNPVFWVTVVYGAVPWIYAISTPDAVRTFHNRLAIYDAATGNAIDPYLALRSAYLQYRKEKNAK